MQQANHDAWRGFVSSQAKISSHFSRGVKFACKSSYMTVKMFLQTKFSSKYLILYRTYQSLSGTQKFSLDLHFGTENTKISSQNISF